MCFVCVAVSLYEWSDHARTLIFIYLSKGGLNYFEQI